MKVERELVDAVRLLEPGPLALVTSLFRSEHTVMTAAWLMAVSLEPPLLAVAIHPARLTHALASGSETLALSFPTADLLAHVHLCGTVSGCAGDKFVAARLTPVDAQVVEAPLVGECVAHVECGVLDRARWGDHDLFVLQPLAVVAEEESFDGRWLVDVDAGKVLHHLRADAYATPARSWRAAPLPEE